MIVSNCDDDNCPAFGIDEAGPGMSWVQGADPDDPTREIRVLMATADLLAISRKVTG